MKSGSTYNNNIRRWFHFLSISAFGLFLWISSFPTELVTTYLGIITCIFICLDLLRIHTPYLNGLASDWFSFLLRKHEMYSLSGSSWFLISALLSLSLFSKPLVILGFFYLAIGDPLASYIGIKFGSKQIGEKTWVGFFGFFIPCTLVGIFWLLQIVELKMAIIAAVNSALVAGLCEKFVNEMDDNLLTPLASSLVATLILI